LLNVEPTKIIGPRSVATYKTAWNKASCYTGCWWMQSESIDKKPALSLPYLCTSLPAAQLALEWLSNTTARAIEK